MQTCSSCRFWDELDEERLDGLCRIGRPAMAGTIAPHGDAVYQNPQASVWPATNRDDWCGEHQPHPQKDDEA